jgi:hypothetical protein
MINIYGIKKKNSSKELSFLVVNKKKVGYSPRGKRSMMGLRDQSEL